MHIKERMKIKYASLQRAAQRRRFFLQKLNQNKSPVKSPRSNETYFGFFYSTSGLVVVSTVWRKENLD